MDKNQQKQILEIFQEFGRVFYKSSQERLRNIESDKSKAFSVFPGTFFYRGRNDTTSEHYKRVAEKKFQRYGLRRLLENPDVMSEQEVIISLVNGKEIRRSLNNKLDRKMFRASLKKLSSVKDNNFVSYTKHKILNGEFEAVYKEMLEIDGAGPKTTALYLRDIVFAFRLKDCLQEEDYLRLFPVDTWVRKICKKLRLAEQSDNDDILIRKVVSKCRELRMNPLLVNAGMWYSGKFSPEIVINNLQRIRIQKYDDW